MFFLVITLPQLPTHCYFPGDELNHNEVSLAIATWQCCNPPAAEAYSKCQWGSVAFHRPARNISVQNWNKCNWKQKLCWRPAADYALQLQFLPAHSRAGGTQGHNMLWETLRSICNYAQLEGKGDCESSLLTIKNCPLPIYFCVLQVGVFNGWVIVWHKNLLEKLNSESTLPHTTISNNHQLVRGEVFAGNGTCSHASSVLNLLEKETISNHSAAIKRGQYAQSSFYLLPKWEWKQL